MSSIPQVCRGMKTVFEQDAVRLAQAAGLRQRSMTFSQLASVLVLGWWQHPHGGPSALARFAGSLGLRVCKEQIDCHFTERTANWLLALLQQAIGLLIASAAVSLPLLSRFSAVLVEDGSTITLPGALKEVWRGCGGGSSNRQANNESEQAARKSKPNKTQASVKVTVRWDLLAGRLDGPHLQEGRRHELTSVLREHPIVKGGLWIADLGYWTLNWLGAVQRGGAYFLMRYKAGIVLWSGRQRLDLLAVLPTVVGERLERLVEVGADKAIKQVRLLAERVPEAVATERREHYMQYVKAHSKPINAYVLELCQWTIVLTNAPAELLSHSQALMLMRARWQIELLFKLWKQHGCIDQWNGNKPWRVLCEVYAKLLAMIVQHWVLLLACWDDPHRSLPAVAEVLRQQVPTLVHGLMGRLPLQRALRWMVQSVQGQCSIPQRSTRPSTSHLLLSGLDPGLT